MQLTLTATSEDRGARIDAWLAAHVEGLTRSPEFEQQLRKYAGRS